MLGSIAAAIRFGIVDNYYEAVERPHLSGFRNEHKPLLSNFKCIEYAINYTSNQVLASFDALRKCESAIRGYSGLPTLTCGHRCSLAACQLICPSYSSNS